MTGQEGFTFTSMQGAKLRFMPAALSSHAMVRALRSTVSSPPRAEASAVRVAGKPSRTRRRDTLPPSWSVPMRRLPPAYFCRSLQRVCSCSGDSTLRWRVPVGASYSKRMTLPTW